MAPNTAITDTGPGDAADVQTTMIEDVRNGDPAMDEWEVKQMNTHLEDGTVVMFAHLGGEKEGLGSKLLIPRPTTDPNDPLVSRPQGGDRSLAPPTRLILIDRLRHGHCGRNMPSWWAFVSSTFLAPVMSPGSRPPLFRLVPNFK